MDTALKLYRSTFDLPAVVREKLPSDALEVFKVAANEVIANGETDPNAPLRAGWEKVSEVWERPPSWGGKKWLRRRTREPRPRRVKEAAVQHGEAADPAVQAAHDEAVEKGAHCTHGLPAVVKAQITTCKVDDELGLVFGWAICCTIDGQPYFDLQGDHIPEPVMLKSAADFMQHSRVACDMHERVEGSDDVPVPSGTVVFAFPLTSDIAKKMEVVTRKTGLWIGMLPDDPAILDKFRSGEYSGFSIGGDEVHDEPAGQ